MASRTATKKRTIDVKSLAAELRVPVKQGRVKTVRGRYYVTIGKMQREIPVGEIVSAADVKKVVGTEVPVVVSGGAVVAIGLPFNKAIVKRRWILCYLPAPRDLFNKIDPELRRELIQRYVDLKVIPAKFGAELADQL
jgi:hypothetical protein